MNENTATLSLSTPERVGWTGECLFWLHIYVIAGGVGMGLVLPWWLALLLVVGHRLHLFIFDGCILSKVQQKTHTLDESQNFLEQAALRFSGRQVSQRVVKIIDRVLACMSVAVIGIAQTDFKVAFAQFLAALLAGSVLYFALCTISKNIACAGQVCTRSERLLPKPLSQLNMPVLGTVYAGLLLVVTLLPLTVVYIPLLALLACGVALSVYLVLLQVASLSTICQHCMNVHGMLYIFIGLTLYRLV